MTRPATTRSVAPAGGRDGRGGAARAGAPLHPGRRRPSPARHFTAGLAAGALLVVPAVAASGGGVTAYLQHLAALAAALAVVAALVVAIACLAAASRTDDEAGEP